MPRRAIAVLGGAFDPVHNGHLHLARRALRDLPIARVHLLPNGKPPHRPPPAAAWDERVALCRGVAGRRITVGREESPQCTRWTVDTLRRLRQRHKRRVILIIGADAFSRFHHWRQWRRILSRANIAVAARPGAADKQCVRRRARHPRELASGAGAVFYWRADAPDISSTEIRRRLAIGDTTGLPLPAAVLRRIRQKKLYAR